MDAIWAAIVGSVVGGAIGIGGIFVGAIISQRTNRRAAEVRVRVNITAVSTEISENFRKAEVYLAEGYASPAYRLSEIYFSTSLPMLLADNGLTMEESKFLLDFYDHVQQFNFSLDRLSRVAEQSVGDAGTNKQIAKLLKSEATRARQKASHFIWQKGTDKGKIADQYDRLPADSRIRQEVSKSFALIELDITGRGDVTVLFPASEEDTSL